MDLPTVAHRRRVVQRLLAARCIELAVYAPMARALLESGHPVLAWAALLFAGLSAWGVVMAARTLRGLRWMRRKLEALRDGALWTGQRDA